MASARGKGPQSQDPGDGGYEDETEPYVSQERPEPDFASTLELSSDELVEVSEPSNEPVHFLGKPVGAMDFGHRYERLELLGRGGMGVVDLVEDRQVGRRVAMKTLMDPTEGRDSVEELRFMREASIQGQLEHPTIPAVYDVGVNPHGQAYFTMQRVRGVTLHDIFRKRADGRETHVSLRRLLEAFGRVCLAVHFAHHRRVVHRDLKPTNIMLGRFGEVHVLDWGIAHLAEEGPSAATQQEVTLHDVSVPAEGLTLTGAGQMIGTMGYAAPEQLNPELGERGPATDIYSLGAILFEILSGERLHPRNEMGAAMSTLEGTADPRPSSRAGAHDIARDFDAICTRATTFDPKKRFRTARQFHDAVDRVLDARLFGTRPSAETAGEVVAKPAPERQPTTPARPPGASAPPPRAESSEKLETGVTPEDVITSLEDAHDKRTRLAGRVAAVAYASLGLYLPLFLWAGVESVRPLIRFYALVMSAAAISFWVSQQKKPSDYLVVMAMLTSTGAFVSSATLFGALVLMPGLVALNTTAFSLVLRQPWRSVNIALGVLCVAIPGLMELWGDRYVFEPTSITIFPRAVLFEPAPALLMLIIGGIATVLTGALATAMVRQSLDDTERKLQTLAWQLEQRRGPPSGGATG